MDRGKIAYYNSLIAQNIVKFFGYEKMLVVGKESIGLLAELCKLGVDAYALVEDDGNASLSKERFINSKLDDKRLMNQFDCVVLRLEFSELCSEYNMILSNAYNITNRHMVFDNLAYDNLFDWELPIFQTGFRKHYNYYDANHYSEITGVARGVLGLYSKIKDTLRNKYDMKFLETIRTLHTDMSRETGCRSDGHIVRYSLATEFVQFGDTVLDCACGLGYGTEILIRNTGAVKAIGIDITQEAISYAVDNFGCESISFQVGDAQKMSQIEDESVDFISSFETLEHIPQPKEFLKEAYRVLKPGGRIIVSVPNEWLDENGKDPSPYHLQTYTWSRLKTEMEELFLTEKAWELTMDGYFLNGKSFSSERKLREFDINSNPSTATECLLFLGMKNPLQGNASNYKETAWGDYGENHKFVDFKRYYINPYIWKSVISSPNRDVPTNISLCKKIINEYPQNSADYGAALCYISYRTLENNNSSVEDVLGIISKGINYREVKTDNPHVYRWQISITYVIAMLYFKVGEYEAGVKTLNDVLRYDAKKFSITIATKQILAYERLMKININQAQDKGREVINFMKNILNNLDWNNLIGDENNQVPFGLYELGNVLMLSSACSWISKYKEKKFACNQRIAGFLNQDNRGFDYVGNFSVKTQNELEQVSNELAQTKTGMEQIQNELIQTKNKLEQKQYELAQAKDGLENAQKDLAQVNNEILLMKNSRSWKATKSLRALERILHKTEGNKNETKG